jgi:pyruvate/oxaloacetate carboxyltransferase
MSQNRPILYLNQPCDDAVQDFVMRINRAGLYAIRTFDLHDTRDRETACSCPHHGTAQCDCQMVVILVYGEDDRPASVVVHGHNGQTWFSLVESLGTVNPRLEAQICGILTPSTLEQTAGDTV